MKSRNGWISLGFALGLCALSQVAAAQRVFPGRSVPSPCSSGNGVVSLHAPIGERISLGLCDGHPLGGIARGGQGEPLTLASGDFDQDGTPDLISGYKSSKGGSVTINRGNVLALWPYGAARIHPPDAFFPEARSFAVSEQPDFLLTGDFDADGHWDILTAMRGSSSLYFLRGDGHGGFAAARRIAVAGAITEMIAGEVNRRDGLADLVLGVTNAAGSLVQIYQSARGAIAAQPETFKLGQPATSMALGRFDAGVMNDLAVASGNQLVVIRSRDGQITADAPRVTVQELGFSIKTIAAGDFTGKGPSIAALDESGTVHMLVHAVSQSTLAGQQSFQLSRPGKDGKPSVNSGSMTPGLATRLRTLRESPASAEAEEWTEHGSVHLPSGFAQEIPHLLVGRLSGSTQEDLVIADAGNNQVHVLSGRPAGAKALNTQSAATEPMRLLASLQANAAPVAVLPMRLGKHGLQGLVTLHAGQFVPTVTPQDVPPTNVFVVTNTSDITAVGGTPPAGSLRAAMNAAENASGDNNGGTYEIDFNIPTSDPNYNPADGSFLIRPLSQSVPNAMNDFALPPINATLIIDGYTQPGASPNTLANADNAKILIRIDGSRATTPGGSGLVPFDDVGSVYRGLDFTGWTNPDVSTSGGQSTASGAEGIEANGVGDFIEGNFFGTDPTGKRASPNRIGIFADNGPGFGSTAPGNVIGGTVPQARNILSANNNSGILFLATALEGQLQGNFIGLDATGTAIVSNLQEPDRSNSFDGVGLNGSTITIGGTLPGAANVIAGNGTNVDINDLTEGNAARNSVVQGNLIGTNASGTASIANQGYGVSILHNPTYMTIGGTTPAARNIISGNLGGVYIFDNAFYNVVQGNFIGTDITGTTAVPNVQQGVITGATSTSAVPAGYTTIGGSTAGSGNVISGNTQDGIQISGTGPAPGGSSNTTNTIQGNFIGTDPTGANAIPNGGNGVYLFANATNNIIGGTNPGSGNIIADNKGHGVLIDPGTANPGEGINNNTIANAILSNNGAGVRVVSGSQNRISQNSIFGNKALGIDVDASGPNAISHCNASATGANSLQNAPLLTTGSGNTFISATATDPNGNTSEFSNAVASTSAGDVVSLLGNFDSTPNTTFTIEFFSSPTADPSGFGQGQTFLGSTSVTTSANCTVTVNDPVDTTTADLSVTLAADTTQFQVGPDFGEYTFTGTVANHGPATAHNVVFTDTLPAGFAISNAYCNVGPCQAPAVTTLGNCTITGNQVSCNMGTMAAGATASVTLPVQSVGAGTFTDTATVQATEADPKLVNNTATLQQASYYPFPSIDHVDPASAITITNGSLPLTVYGTGFLSNSVVAFDGTAVTTTAYLDNQVCGGPFEPAFCSALQVAVPASVLGSAGSHTITITNPNPGPGGNDNEPASTTFMLATACTYDPEFSGFNPVDAEGDTLIPESVNVTTNAPTCQWSAMSNASWLVILDRANSSGSGSFDVAVAPNTGGARTGTVTVAGKTVEIDQEAGDSTICSYALNPSTGHVAATGGAGTFAVTTGSDCSYFVEPYPQDAAQFVTIPQSSSLLVGNGNPAYTVAANHGAPRTGAIMVGGDVYTLTQDAPSCYYTLDSTSAVIPVNGGSGSIGVTASSPGCAWIAKSSNASLVSITSGGSATGNGTVHYTVPQNTGGPESPTITIGDANGYSIFSIAQASAFTCTFTVTPSPLTVSSNGTSNYFTITASYSFCKWTAASNDPTALTVTQATSGTGSGAVYYSVAQNTTSAARTLTITAGCQTFTVNQNGQQTTAAGPTITTLSPTSATAGSPAFTLTVNGSGFVSGSALNFNGNARPTTFVSASQLTAAIPASDLANAGSPLVVINNPAPNPASSNSVIFTVSAASTNPVPAITTLQPASVTAGSGALTLTVNGTGFISSSMVKFKGTTLTTIFVSTTKLTAAIPASDVTTVGTAAITVTNPTPGGGTSNSATFTITAVGSNPVPSITSLQPVSATAGSGAFILTLKGSGFIAKSAVNFGGSAKATTFVSATQLTAAILATDITKAGVIPVTVMNPTPGGGTSTAINFTVDAATVSAPAVTLTPTSLNFPSTIVGSTTAAQSITVSNSGNALLAISGITITGTNPTDFGETTTCGSTLHAGSSCSISITFTPASATSFAATVSLADDASASPQTVSLSGTGTAPPTPTFTITSSTPAQSILAGGAAKYSFTVAAQNGAITSPVTFSVTGLPAGATATFAPASITVGSGSATSQLTIQTVAPVAPTAASLRSNLSVPLLASTFPLFGLIFASGKRRRRWLTLCLVMIASLTGIATITGCGGGFASTKINTGQNYNITITATDGNQQKPTTVQLTVN